MSENINLIEWAKRLLGEEKAPYLSMALEEIERLRTEIKRIEKINPPELTPDPGHFDVRRELVRHRILYQSLIGIFNALVVETEFGPPRDPTHEELLSIINQTMFMLKRE